MDYSPRQRYHARRKAVVARRRVRLFVVGVVLLVGGLSWLLLSRRSPSPALVSSTAIVTPQPTSVGALAAASPKQPEVARSLKPARMFHDLRLTYEPDFYVPEVQAFLDNQPGPLKTFSAPVGNRRHSFAEIIVGQSLYYSVNPRVVLALLESQGQLLSSSNPSPQQLDWALGYRGKRTPKTESTATAKNTTTTPDTQDQDDQKLKGVTAQIRWAVRQLLYARRDFPAYAPLTYADNTQAPAPAGWELGQYALARVLAPATTPDKLAERMEAFNTTYTRLFGDPRAAPTNWPGVAEPFLVSPLPRPARVTSFFDHDGPFLSRNSGTFSYWGQNETDLSYDGHDGWDYAIGPPDPALAAAPGLVVFAGNADDNCATTAAVIDHGNGYRTLYWHLSQVDVQIGQRVAAGDVVGITGASGCAFGAHLHLGVQYLGRNTDPYGYCGRAADPWAEHGAGTISTWLWKDRPSPCGPPPPNAIVVDTNTAGFTKTGSWETAPLGYGGDALFSRSVAPVDQTAQPDSTPVATPTAQATASATYRPSLPNPGRYRVLAYVPYVINGLDDAVDVVYQVHHTGGKTQVTVDLQQYANEWVDLGTYDFAPGVAEVALDNRARTRDQSVWADAVMWLPETKKPGARSQESE